jgi:hypothetical protein
VLAGGGALLQGLDELIANEILRGHRHRQDALRPLVPSSPRAVYLRRLTGGVSGCPFPNAAACPYTPRR